MAKRILVYTNHYYPEQFKINDVVNWFLEENFEIRVITGIPNYPKGKFYKGYYFLSKKLNEVKQNIIINRLPLIPRGSGSKLLIILNYLSYFLSTIIFTFYLIFFKKKYDVILVHHTSPFFISIAPIIYKKFKSSKNILWDLDIWPQTLVGMNIVRNKTLINILEFIVKKIYKYYDKVLVSSNSIKDTLKVRIKYNKIDVFPNWADELIESKKYKKNIDFKVDPDFLNIMYMGNVGEAQDFQTVINCFEKLKNFRVRLYIIGGGRYKFKLQKLVNVNGLNSQVKFVAYQNLSNIYSYSLKADFLFLSLKNEKIFADTLPAKLQTYMSLGKPILGMISGEANKLINDSNIGIAVDSGDYIKLAEEIKNILDNKYDENIMASNSFKLYEKKFKSSLRRKQIKKIIKSI